MSVERAERPQTPRDLLRRLHLLRAKWGAVIHPRHVARCAAALLANARGRRDYAELDAAALSATRRSDTVFIFGSGRSLLELRAEEWARIAGFQTIAFGEFHRKRLARVDYHMINEVADPVAYAQSIHENPAYADTIFVVQRGWLAHRGNQMIGRRLLPTGRRVFRYRRYARWGYADPSESLERGLVHGPNSCVDAANLALLMGWRRIVFVGVDLFDRQYFYLPPGETTAGPSVDAFGRFPGAADAVELFKSWRPIAHARGAELLVYSPSSLLADALDVFRWDDA